MKASAEVGAFVVFEGLDGAGKSTQVRRLRESLERAGVEVEAVREPGGTPAGEAVRSIMFGPDAKPLEPLTWAFLMNAARAQLVVKKIVPALESGKTVLADRFWYSTMAYQGGGGGVDLEVVRSMSRVATGGLKPDLVIYLDLPPERVAERKAREDPNVLDSQPLAFHRRVASGYQTMIASEPQLWRSFDALKSEDDIEAQIREHVFQRLGIGEAVLTS